MYVDSVLYNSVMFRYLNPREGTETGMMNEDYESFVKVQIP